MSRLLTASKRSGILIGITALIVITAAAVFATAPIKLPSWAPKNPSPEFLNAARYLRQLPTKSKHGTSSVDIAEWECFGTFSNKQLKPLMNLHTVTFPVKSMSAKQKKALYAVIDKKGRNRSGESLRDIIYRSGAAKDLSNVNLNFNIQGKEVWLFLCITKHVSGNQYATTSVTPGTFAYLRR